MIFSLLAAGLMLASPELSGKVIGISDGDTLTVLVDKKPVKIRLDGIDAPESRQAFGTKARTKLSELAFGKIVRVEAKDKDDYGRTIGIVFADGVNVNAEMVKAGLAWHYKRYSMDSELDRLEREARQAKRGLWADKSPVEPWKYRIRARAKAGAA